MKPYDVFSANYFVARDRFRDAAKALGARLSSFPIHATGPNDEELTIDVALVGAPGPAQAVVVSSGIHGVEGFFGSAIQTAWLRSLAGSGQQLPAQTAVVLVHSLNPFGFAWRRRVNESNVDLNRNFLLPGDHFAGAPPEARKLNWFINPGTPPSRFSLFLPQAVFLILRYGKMALQAALSQGQFDFENGLFFGGKRAEETTTLVQTQFDSWSAGASRVLHLDFHSGLGRFGECRLLSVEVTDSPQGSWLADRFSPHRVEAIGTGVARNTARGAMGDWLNATLSGQGRVYAFLAPEFGTYSGIQVFKALREENRVHRHSQHRTYENIKERLVEVFCPASGVWRAKVVQEGLRLINQAVQICQDEGWKVPV